MSLIIKKTKEKERSIIDSTLLFEGKSLISEVQKKKLFKCREKKEFKLFIMLQEELKKPK